MTEADALWQRPFFSEISVVSEGHAVMPCLVRGICLCNDTNMLTLVKTHHSPVASLDRPSTDELCRDIESKSNPSQQMTGSSQPSLFKRKSSFISNTGKLFWDLGASSWQQKQLWTLPQRKKRIIKKTVKVINFSFKSTSGVHLLLCLGLMFGGPLPHVHSEVGLFFFFFLFWKAAEMWSTVLGQYLGVFVA